MNDVKTVENWVTDLMVQLVLQVERALATSSQPLPDSLQTTFTSRGVTTKLALEFTRLSSEAQDEKA